MSTISRRIALAALLAAAAGVQAQEGRTYTPGPFDRLAVSGNARIELTQGEQDQVFVPGDEAAQKNIRLRLAGGRLQIETEDDWKFWSRSAPQLRVQMRQVRELVISGASDIVAARPLKAENLRVSISGQGLVHLSELNANQLRFEISGAGDGELAGRVDDLRVRVSGKGKLAAERLRSASADVTISGIGNADIWTTDELRVTVSGIGKVNYWGQPKTVQRHTSGISEVNAKGERR